MKKPTAADRPEFRRQVLDLVERLGIESGEVAQDVTVVCVRVADFDPADNVLWELPGNKSAVRPDVLCFGCRSVMAMSNDAYGKYGALDKKPRVCCTHCVKALLG